MARYTIELTHISSPSEAERFTNNFTLELDDNTPYTIEEIKDAIDNATGLCYSAMFAGGQTMDIDFTQDGHGKVLFCISARMEYDPTFKNDMDFINGKGPLKESIYSRGYKLGNDKGRNIFALVRDLQDYTSEMDHDEAVEAAVYATADSIKDGVIHI